MYIARHKKFDKQFKKLTLAQQQSFTKKLSLFINKKNYESLRIHSLSGKYNGCMSMNVTGNIRAIFETVDTDTIFFIAIGSHSTLYH
ncbi:type II toxin-antitoxin system mRNA interferase toxin, RelE/StbE family [Candidatus Wolfebacteria bacterium]|nr:type II toxin-antitoxin system mRNA interferase toxin, RelE/StbE family [Candidatus Wolfebacteria bacterium]